MLVKLAVKILRKALRDDPDFYANYKSNIAMAFYDVAKLRGWNKNKIILDANIAADNFLRLFIQ
jgi:hypothetical protein